MDPLEELLAAVKADPDVLAAILCGSRARGEEAPYALAIATAKRWEDFRHVREGYLEAAGRGR